MPNSKNPFVRELIIDRCLSGGKEMTLKEIMDEVNKDMAKRQEPGVYAKSTLLKDIKSISERWNVEILKTKRGDKFYYHYKDPVFSIYRSQLRTEDIEKLHQTIGILKNFVGLPHFEWIEELSARIHATTCVNQKQKPIVSFAHNPEYAHSLRHFTPLFDFIMADTAIELTYKRFNSELMRTHTVHPYHLKEYADRWYLVGVTESHPDSLTCFAFDRIVSYTRSDVPYRPNTSIDIEDHFNSMVGLTIYNDTEPQEVQLWVEDSEYPYLMTNPIHHSQQLVRNEQGGKVISLRLFVNFELEMRILSYGEYLKVLSPVELQQRIKKRCDASARLYADSDSKD